MTKLAYLHEPGVLYNLRCRYDVNEIYVSSILLDHVLRCIKINDNFLSFLSDYTFTLMTFDTGFLYQRLGSLVFFMKQCFEIHTWLDLNNCLDFRSAIQFSCRFMKQCFEIHTWPHINNYLLRFLVSLMRHTPLLSLMPFEPCNIFFILLQNYS